MAVSKGSRSATTGLPFQTGDGAMNAGIDAEDSHALSLRSSAATASASRSARQAA
jgi:hypothetical protein